MHDMTNHYFEEGRELEDILLPLIQILPQRQYLKLITTHD